MHLVALEKKRRALRRAVCVPCIAVSTDSYRLISQQVLDLSPRGMLVACNQTVSLGDEVFVSFLPPGEGRWMNAQAEVTRLIPGLRTWDPGPSAGLVFTNLTIIKRGELLARLAGIPPTVPRRPLRFRGLSAWYSDEPVFPLVVRRGLPDGICNDFYTRLPRATVSPIPVARGVFAN
jgi:hypothetical protein